MVIELSHLERNTLLEWSAGNERYDSSKVIFPEEDMLKNKLKAHAGGSFEMSDSALAVIQSWIESSVDANFGSGAIVNPVEKTLLDKIRKVSGSARSAGIPEHSVPQAKTPGSSNATAKGNRKIKLLWLVVCLIALAVFYSFFTKSRKPENPVLPAALVSGGVRVEFAVGQVEMNKGDGWQPLTIGSVLSFEDSVKTGVASQVTLSRDARSVKVEEKRLFKVEELF